MDKYYVAISVVRKTVVVIGRDQGYPTFQQILFI